jgi:membrane associated rhomboid family serine protease
MVSRLIFINVGAFVIINIIRLALFLFNQGQIPEFYNELVHFFCLSKDWQFNLTHPWVILTHMFFHTDFFHVLWNMLYLYWFGRILGDLMGDRHVLPLYLLGGIAGGMVFFVSANFFSIDHLIGDYAMGASAAVMAIVVAAGVTAPDYLIHLLFFGAVRLKYIVAVLVFLDLIGIAGYHNTGGHFAHLGGAAMGWLFVAQARRGRNWSKPINQITDTIGGFFDRLFTGSQKGPKVIFKNPEAKKSAPHRRGKMAGDLSHQEQLDSILDKIKDSGYESLTAEEKEFLFHASKK